MLGRHKPGTQNEVDYMGSWVGGIAPRQWTITRVATVDQGAGTRMVQGGQWSKGGLTLPPTPGQLPAVPQQGPAKLRYRFIW